MGFGEVCASLLKWINGAGEISVPPGDNFIVYLIEFLEKNAAGEPENINFEFTSNLHAKEIAVEVFGHLKRFKNENAEAKFIFRYCSSYAIQTSDDHYMDFLSKKSG